MLPMQEKEFQLPTPDGKVIYGVLTKSPMDTNKVLVLAHGLCGHIAEHMHMEAKRFFSNNGYDVVRFGFYASPEDARKLEETTLSIHAADLNLVCDHFRPLYQKMFVAGHSYGGLALLIANPQATAFSFWDASFTPYKGFWQKEAKKLSGTSYYTLGWGALTLIGEAMYEEGRQMDALADGYARKVTVPSLVVLAGDNSENPERTVLYEALRCSKMLEDIDRADHNFTKNDTLAIMFRKVLAWFEQV